MGAPTPSRFGPEHRTFIVVVEDNQAVRELLADVLSTIRDTVVWCAACGSDALDFLHALSPDLLLLDYHLPDMTGLQLYDQIHAHQAFQHLPVILMSTTLPHSELEKRHMIGLHKPFRFAELREAMAQAFRGEEADLSC
jgi:CheY-like chemotaxis protein